MTFGSLVFVAVTVRLLDRYADGRPFISDDEPTEAAALALAVHKAF